ncbi:MAG: hypothetical protein R2940_04235 [Syntrophotaleaceae bacterium]
MNRQKKLLYVLLGMFVLALIYAISSYPRRERVVGEPAAAVPSQQQVQAPAPRTGGQQKRLPQVEQEAEVAGTAEVKRNIFEPLFPPAPPPPPPPVPGTGAGEGGEPAPQDLPPPAPPFELLGYVQKNQDQIVFLSRANEVFIVRPEERFGENNQYRIMQAGPDRVIIREQGGQETTLFFSEQESGVQQGGQPFSGFQAPQQGEDLPMPEPPAEPEMSPEEPQEAFPEEFQEPPEQPVDAETGPADEEAATSPLAPGLIDPEDELDNGNENIIEEETAPSGNEVPNE